MFSSQKSIAPTPLFETGIIEGIRGGTETIWVVDDDIVIAHMEKNMLTAFWIPGTRLHRQSGPAKGI